MGNSWRNWLDLGMVTSKWQELSLGLVQLSGTASTNCMHTVSGELMFKLIYSNNMYTTVLCIEKEEETHPEVSCAVVLQANMWQCGDQLDENMIKGDRWVMSQPSILNRVCMQLYSIFRVPSDQFCPWSCYSKSTTLSMHSMILFGIHILWGYTFTQLYV